MAGISTNFYSSIEKLNSENYHTWKWNIKHYLNTKGLRGFIDATVTPPGPLATWTEAQEFEDRKAKAAAHLILSVDDRRQILVRDLKDPTEIWDKLSAHYKTKSRARIVQLRQEFHDLRMGESEDAEKWITRVDAAANKLAEAGRPCKDEDIAFRLIQDLPERFRKFVLDVYRWSDDHFTSHNIETTLLAEDAQLKYQEMSKLKDNRKQKGSKISKKRTKSHNSTFLIVEKVEDNLESHEREEALDWIWDSTSGAHLCCQRQCFTRFEETRPEEFECYAGTFQVTGRGSIEIFSIIDGKKCRVRFNNVRYAPQGQWNVISAVSVNRLGGTWVGGNNRVHVKNKGGNTIMMFEAYEGLFRLRKQVTKEEYDSWDEVNQASKTVWGYIECPPEQ